MYHVSIYLHKQRLINLFINVISDYAKIIMVPQDRTEAYVKGGSSYPFSEEIVFLIALKN